MHPTLRERFLIRRARARKLLVFVMLSVGLVFAGLAVAFGASLVTGIGGMTVETAGATIADNLLYPYEFADSTEGGMRALVGGEPINFPALETDVQVDAQGDIANVTVTQVFSNPAPTPVNATYVFPLPHGAAVHAMTMEVGNERIRAQIDRIEVATETFAEAQSNGQAAALVTQERANVFTQRIANLVPGLPVRVTIEYVQTVPQVDGTYELVVPLVVGPRYFPGSTQHVQPTSTYPFMPSELNSAFVTGPSLPATDPEVSSRVAIAVNLDAGSTIRSARSTTHRMAESWDGADQVSLELVDERVPDDRDFRFLYDLSSDELSAAMLSHHDDRGGYFTLRVNPPQVIEEADAVPREVVFVIDTSGSMRGEPLQLSRDFMTEALTRLRPDDTFRVIRFGDIATEFAETPVIASTENIDAALRYVSGLSTGGGTRMLTGVHQALDPPVAEGTIRLVVFLTDGYIGNDSEVLEAVGSGVGDARLFSFGVGAGVNRYLLDEMGRRGRGFSRYVSASDTPAEVVSEFAERIQTPVLTDLWIDWGEAEVSETFPSAIPDVFAGYPVRVSGRYANPGSHRIIVHGTAAGTEIEIPVDVELVNQPSGRSAAIPLVWARAAIADAMGQFSQIRGQSDVQDALKERVTQLGLDHALVTRWTAFVAVSEAIVNDDPSNTAAAVVPTATVSGTTFGGSATPEPATWLGLLLAGGLVNARRHRRG